MSAAPKGGPLQSADRDNRPPAQPDQPDLVETCVVLGPTGAGKTRLMRQWARQSAGDQLWTLIQRGGIDPDDGLPPHVMGLALAHDCACCNGKLVLQTHLGRTLRLRRPHRVFIEADHTAHVGALMDWLGSGQWSNWLAPARCVLLLPLSARQDASTEEALVRQADVVCVIDAHRYAAHEVAARLLDLRRFGGAAQVRINAPLNDLRWSMIQGALASGRRPL